MCQQGCAAAEPHVINVSDVEFCSSLCWHLSRSLKDTGYGDQKGKPGSTSIAREVCFDVTGCGDNHSRGFHWKKIENLQVQAHFESTDGKHQCGTSLAASYLVWHLINYMLLIFQLFFISWVKNKRSQSRILSGVLCVLSSVIKRYPDRIIKSPVHNRYSLEITRVKLEPSHYLKQKHVATSPLTCINRTSWSVSADWPLPVIGPTNLGRSIPRMLTLFPADVITLPALFHFKLHTGWRLCVISSPVTFLRNTIRRYNWKHLYVSGEKKKTGKQTQAYFQPCWYASTSTGQQCL